MKIFTQLRFYFVVVVLSFLALLVNYFNLKSELDRCRNDVYYVPGRDLTKSELERQRDSLGSELFVKEIELGRYEVAFHILMERNPKAAKEYGDIISNETE